MSKVEQPGEFDPLAYGLGRDAFFEGKGPTDNPYPTATHPWSRQIWAEEWHKLAKRRLLSGAFND